jgi:hypothetical protein
MKKQKLEKQFLKDNAKTIAFVSKNVYTMNNKKNN